MKLPVIDTLGATETTDYREIEIYIVQHSLPRT